MVGDEWSATATSMLEIIILKYSQTGGKLVHPDFATGIKAMIQEGLTVDSHMRRELLCCLWPPNEYSVHHTAARVTALNTEADEALVALMAPNVPICLEIRFESSLVGWGSTLCDESKTSKSIRLNDSFLALEGDAALQHPWHISSARFALKVVVWHEMTHLLRNLLFGRNASPPKLRSSLRSTHKEDHSGYALEELILGGTMIVWWKRGHKWDWSHVEAVGLETATEDFAIENAKLLLLSATFDTLTPDLVRQSFAAEIPDDANFASARTRGIECDFAQMTVDGFGGTHGNPVSTQNEDDNAIAGPDSTQHTSTLTRVQWLDMYCERSSPDERCVR